MTPSIARYNDDRPAPSETNLTREKDGSTAWGTVPEGTANGGSLPSLPIALQTGATIDTTTYDDPINAGQKLTTLVLPSDQVAFAMAIAGDAFPRFLIMADPGDGIRFGDGTYDAYNQNGGIAGSAGSMLIEGPHANLSVGEMSAAAQGPLSDFQGALRISSAAAIQSGVGSPNGVKGGSGADLYIDAAAPDVNHWLYRCTVTGPLNGGASLDAFAGGSGYAVDDTFTVDGGGAPAQGVVQSVGGGGAPDAVSLVTHGSGYTAGMGVATTATSGVGTGLTVDILVAVWVAVGGLT